jgi:hypothetical protein
LYALVTSVKDARFRYAESPNINRKHQIFREQNGNAGRIQEYYDVAMSRVNTIEVDPAYFESFTKTFSDSFYCIKLKIQLRYRIKFRELQ